MERPSVEGPSLSLPRMSLWQARQERKRLVEAEERVLVKRFGSQYREYREQVSALGVPWCCCGFDADA